MIAGEIRANKVLLSLASTVFKNQFFGNFEEKPKVHYK
jgi:hypothetical protein